MNLDLELDGVANLQEQLDDLEDAGESEAVYVTGAIDGNGEEGTYAVFLEFGTENMPPYPWFRPAIREFRANPERFIQDNTDFGSVDEINTTTELVATVAVALSERMSDNVSANTAADRSPGVDPEHPQRQTGNLNAAISAERIQ